VIKYSRHKSERLKRKRQKESRMRFLHTMTVNPSLETDWDKAAPSVASFPARQAKKQTSL
jgi:hypothetical protein